MNHITKALVDNENGLPIYVGAVYFRKSAPPKEDWERDYKQAATDGHNIFRHWFSWSAIEVEPDVYDWEDYDQQLDLGHRYGINTIIAEMIIDMPEWLIHKYPNARIEKADGSKRRSEMHGSCATGGHYCLCLDNEEIEMAAEKFLTTLAKRYRNHPSLLGYDIWNEATMYEPSRYCYCHATQKKFREWLKVKYGDIKEVGKAWRRYSLTSWEQIELPRTFELYPEVFDAIKFWNDNAFYWMNWRRDILKRYDQDHLVVSHGNSRSFNDIATCCGDDWRAAQASDVFGYTYYYGIGCHPLMAGDLIRSAAKGKKFWRAEAIGDSCWNGRYEKNTYQSEKDKMASPENIRADFYTTLISGASGYMTPRWRPLLDGPLFGAFGWYGMDGRTTERSEMVSSLIQWCKDIKLASFWKAKPLKGEIAILIIEEAQMFGFIQSDSENYYNHYYGQCVQGAYEAFLDSNIQCDFVRMDDMSEYDVLYIPFPVALSDDHMRKIENWVNSGGNLIVEGCFGYFSDHGHAHTTQPNRGFEVIFGCKEHSVSFAPDRWQNLLISKNDNTVLTKEEGVMGSLYRQSYEITTATPIGYFEDGSIACIENIYGKGKIRLVGTMPSYAYKKLPHKGTQEWFMYAIAWAGKEQRITLNNENIIARLFRQDKLTKYVWLLNQSEETQKVLYLN
jgi:beta-galactosidase